MISVILKVTCFSKCFDFLKNIFFQPFCGFSGDDEFLGRASMSTAVVAKEGEINCCAELEDVESGTIHWNLSWLPATADKSCLQTGTYISKMCNNEIIRVILSLIKVRSIYLSLIKL